MAKVEGRVIKVRSFQGLPTYAVQECQEGDQWALLRLTDDGLGFYQEGPDFRAGITAMEISDERAVEEISRHSSKDEAIEVRNALSENERNRTLIRAVRLV